jgi:DNA-directed RNA polymerase beta' subunit
MTHVRTVDAVEFEMLTASVIRRMSVLAVTASTAWDKLRRAPVEDGPLDQRLGAVSAALPCSTCGGRFRSSVLDSMADDTYDPADYTCVGHMGHIPLPAPVYTPLTLTPLYAVLRAFCFVCGSSLVPLVARRRLETKARQCATMIEVLHELVDASSACCPACKRTQPRYERLSVEKRSTLGNEWFPVRATFDRTDGAAAVPTPDTYARRAFVVTGARARVVLDAILGSPTTLAFLAQRLGCFGGSLDALKSFFDALTLDALPVLPPCARPLADDGGGSVRLHEYTRKYERIVASALELKKFMVVGGLADGALTTCGNKGISNPLAAISVATNTLTEPFLKPANALVRAPCPLFP